MNRLRYIQSPLLLKDFVDLLADDASEEAVAQFYGKIEDEIDALAADKRRIRAFSRKDSFRFDEAARELHFTQQRCFVGSVPHTARHVACGTMGDGGVPHEVVFDQHNFELCAESGVGITGTLHGWAHRTVKEARNTQFALHRRKKFIPLLYGASEIFLRLRKIPLRNFSCKGIFDLFLAS